MPAEMTAHRLFEGAGHGTERDVQLGADALNDGDDRNCNTSRDEGVLDGGRARFVLQESFKFWEHPPDSR